MNLIKYILLYGISLGLSSVGGAMEKAIEDALNDIPEYHQLRSAIVKKSQKLSGELGDTITPLMYLVMRPKLHHTIPWFITDINAQTNAGTTALMIAVKERHIDVITTLVEHGADMHIQNSNDMSALAMAEAGGEEVKKALTVGKIMARLDGIPGLWERIEQRPARHTVKEKEETATNSDEDCKIDSDPELIIGEDTDFFSYGQQLPAISNSSLYDRIKTTRRAKAPIFLTAESQKADDQPKELPEKQAVEQNAIKRFVCKVKDCGYGTNYSSTFKRHVASHKNRNKRGRSPAANQVSKDITKKQSAKKSRIAHNSETNGSAEKRYTCKCGYSSEYQQNINRHRKTACREK